MRPGFQHLNWSSKDVTEWFVKECRRHCVDLVKIVADFHKRKAMVHRACRRIEEMPLIVLRKNHVYEVLDFAATQRSHLEKVRQTLNEQHRIIESSLQSMYVPRPAPRRAVTFCGVRPRALPARVVCRAVPSPYRRVRSQRLAPHGG